MKIITFLSIFIVKGERRFRKKTFVNRILEKISPPHWSDNSIETEIPLIRQRSFSSIKIEKEIKQSGVGTCEKPKIALGNGAGLTCPDIIKDRDRCRYRCPKGFILKPGSNNIIGKQKTQTQITESEFSVCRCTKADGCNWSTRQDELPVCIAAPKCSNPPKLENGLITCRKGSINGSKCKVKCKKKYTLFGGPRNHFSNQTKLD